MRSEAPYPIIHRLMDMRDPDKIRLVLELDRRADPIQGRLTAPDGHDTPFRGWLLLTALIESARKGTLDHAGGGAVADRPD
jgi:hypothetical protein